MTILGPFLVLCVARGCLERTNQRFCWSMGKSVVSQAGDLQDETSTLLDLHQARATTFPEMEEGRRGPPARCLSPTFWGEGSTSKIEHTKNVFFILSFLEDLLVASLKPIKGC